ncbi:MAG: DUF4430 domain-containing protein [Defluviitaleaceae bacterium]|nr:DUF4430 domain-containing protein [Defluviitaleaceae bacterium]MCL2263398.1 DUF4430 domain-containing protein [Defluviitaleaceae bacterium]
MKKFFALLAIAMVAFAGCGYTAYRENVTVDVTRIAYDAMEIGEGETVFRFEVTDGNGNFYVWNVSTNEATVGAALYSVGLIAGEVQAFGIMVTEVNGIQADFSADGAWWAFYVNGEFATVGVDATYIEEGATYAFVFTR